MRNIIFKGFIVLIAKVNILQVSKVFSILFVKIWNYHLNIRFVWNFRIFIFERKQCMVQKYKKNDDACSLNVSYIKIIFNKSEWMEMKSLHS